jgi:thioredoxin-related protein
VKYSRCKWVLPVLAAALASSANAGVQNGVPLASDLRSAADHAEAACVPLLLEFATDYCEYCVLLEEEVLKPMLLNRDYDQRVLVRKLTLDGAGKLRDFDGHRVSAAALAERYRISLTPTLIFVDRRGHELAERMVGVTTLEFYGGYLDQALDAAREKLRERQHCR